MDKNLENNDSYSINERRQYARIPFSFPVRFKECGYDKDHLKEEGLSQYAYTNNISAGGVQLKLSERIKAGKYIKMKLTLPIYSDCKIINVLGQVVWSRLDEIEKKYAIGIQFLNIDDIDKITLEEFIHESIKDAK